MNGICSFYNVIIFIILAPIATIFVHLIESSVLNLMALEGRASVKYATLVFGSCMEVFCYYTLVLRLQ